VLIFGKRIASHGPNDMPDGARNFAR